MLSSSASAAVGRLYSCRSHQRRGEPTDDVNPLCASLRHELPSARTSLAGPRHSTPCGLHSGMPGHSSSKCPGHLVQAASSSSAGTAPLGWTTRRSNLAQRIRLSQGFALAKTSRLSSSSSLGASIKAGGASVACARLGRGMAWFATAGSSRLWLAVSHVPTLMAAIERRFFWPVGRSQPSRAGPVR